MTIGTYFPLNQVGSMFWNEVDGQISLGDIAATIVMYFNTKLSKFIVELVILAESSGQSPNPVFKH